MRQTAPIGGVAIPHDRAPKSGSQGLSCVLAVKNGSVQGLGPWTLLVCLYGPAILLIWLCAVNVAFCAAQALSRCHKNSWAFRCRILDGAALRNLTQREGPAVRERPPKVEPPQILSGWKEIANYLGKGVRTVQRYEGLLGLPVRRPAGRPSGSVIATRAELDGWVQASPIRKEFRLRSAMDLSASHRSAIEQNLSEMVRLRNQTFELRSEVLKSLELLRNNVYELMGGLNRNPWNGSSPLYSTSERQLLDRVASNSDAPPSKHTKAN